MSVSAKMATATVRGMLTVRMMKGVQRWNLGGLCAVTSGCFMTLSVATCAIWATTPRGGRQRYAYVLIRPSVAKNWTAGKAAATLGEGG